MIKEMTKRIFKPIIDDSVAEVIANRQAEMAEVIETKRNKQDEVFMSIEKFRGRVITAGLRKIFDAKHFSICDLDACLAAARVIPDGEVMRMLRVLHCVDWADMDVNLREDVFSHIMKMFGIEAV